MKTLNKNTNSLVVWAALCFTMAISACSQTENELPPKADVERILADMNYLADDALEGREAGTRGHEIAAKFAANRLAALGLKPLPGSESFLQDAQLITSTIDKTASKAVVTIDGVETPLVLEDDFITVPNIYSDFDAVSGEIVFVGHGISAPTKNYDDYAGIDVTGKIVAFVFQPVNVDLGDLVSHFSNPATRVNLARSKGAVGVIVLFTDKSFSHGGSWEHLIQAPFATKSTGVGSTSALMTKDFVEIVSHPNTSKMLFEGEEMSLEEAMENLNEGKTASFALKKSIALSRKSSREIITSPNVVGMIEGSDPVLKHEYVMFSAHIDHIGIAKDDGHDKTDIEDKIFNGFYDNASGSAIVMEVARMIATQKVKPKRSIIVGLLTAEEKGLLGSQYFTENSPMMANIIADVNIDKILFTEPSTGIMPLGQAHSTIDGYAASIAPNYGLTLVSDAFPEQNYFVRSDHYSFVKKGVPAISLFTIFTEQDGKDPKSLYTDFLEHYHKVSDDSSRPFHKPSAARFTNFSYGLLTGLANAKEAPTFLEGDAFGELFKRK